jgi:hypothetical protein
MLWVQLGVPLWVSTHIYPPYPLFIDTQITALLPTCQSLCKPSQHHCKAWRSGLHLLLPLCHEHPAHVCSSSPTFVRLPLQQQSSRAAGLPPRRSKRLEGEKVDYCEIGENDMPVFKVRQAGRKQPGSEENLATALSAVLCSCTSPLPGTALL